LGHAASELPIFMTVRDTLRTDTASLHQRLRDPSRGDWLAWLGLVIVGAGAYGLSLGWWRSPQQGVFVAVKMPLLILATWALNGMLNGLLAAVLGSGLTFRQTAWALLRSFAAFSAIAGSLAPIALFFTASLPVAGETGSGQAYEGLLITHTAIIAVAGIVANIQLWSWLAHICGRDLAQKVLTAWLAGNLLLGAQLSYTFRPFFGNPDFAVQMFRPNPLDGNFYEVLWDIATTKRIYEFERQPRTPTSPEIPEPKEKPSPDPTSN
jgi:hypothetical protein